MHALRGLISAFGAFALASSGCELRDDDAEIPDAAASAGIGGASAGEGGAAGGVAGGGAGAGAGGIGDVYPCDGDFPNAASEHLEYCKMCDDPEAFCYTEPGNSAPVCTLDNRCYRAWPSKCTSDAECDGEHYCCSGVHCLQDGSVQGICMPIGCGPGPYCVTTDEMTGTCRYVPDLAIQGVRCDTFLDAPRRISAAVRQRSAAQSPPGAVVELFNELDEPLCEPFVFAREIPAFSSTHLDCVTEKPTPISIKVVVTAPDTGDPECDTSNNAETFEVRCDPIPCGLGEFPCPSGMRQCLTSSRCFCVREEDQCFCPELAGPECRLGAPGPAPLMDPEASTPPLAR